MGLDVLRAALPSTGACHFLNFAATAPLLRPSADAMASVARQETEPMGRHVTAWLALLESTRRTIADVIRARPEEIAFTANTSSALSLAAGAVRWRAGDRVLYPADEFPSNRYVWQNLADLGVVAEEIPCERGVGLATQLERRRLDGVRLVAFSAVSYRNGFRADVAAVVKHCHAHGALVAVDAVQAVGAVPVDVRAWGCDFLACGGQKWLLGPVGSGFLVIASDRLAELRVPLVGWASARVAGDFDATRLEFCDGARRFEPGLPDVAALAGLAKSLELFGQAGWSAVFARIAQHNARLRAELAAMGLPPLHEGPPETQAGIVTLELPSEAGAEALFIACERRRILVMQRRRLLRVSAHATTDDADLEAFLDVVADRQAPRARSHAARIEPAQSVSAPRAGGVATSRRPRWRRALVTGATRGLGEGIATALAQRGCGVTLIGRDEPALVSVADRLRRTYGIEAEPVALDLADRTRVTGWLAERQPQLATYDVLVLNAASAQAQPFATTDLHRVHAMFETNFFSPLALTQSVLPGMLERRVGAILTIVTSGARCALPLFSGYAASKGALWAWSEALARELTGSGITVTTFLPPHMETATQRHLGRQALAYYDVPKGSSRTRSPFTIGQQAVAALAAGCPTVVPLGTRVQLAANALAPERMSRRVHRTWRGSDSSERGGSHER